VERPAILFYDVTEQIRRLVKEDVEILDLQMSSNSGLRTSQGNEENN